jgi:hypothetical protein
MFRYKYSQKAIRIKSYGKIKTSLTIDIMLHIMNDEFFRTLCFEKLKIVVLLRAKIIKLINN